MRLKRVLRSFVLLFAVASLCSAGYWAGSRAQPAVPTFRKYHPLWETYKDGIASWSVDAVTAPLNYDYFNSETQLSIASSWFTQDAWNAFIEIPGRAAQVKRVKDSKMLCHANSRGEPLVLDHNVAPGRGEHASNDVTFAVVQTCENLGEAFTVIYMARAHVVWSTDGSVPGVPLLAKLTLTSLP